jgi:hypothetical protein
VRNRRLCTTFAIASIVLLVAIDFVTLVAVRTRGPYDAYLGPTPLAWWLLGVVLVALLAPAVLMVTAQQRHRLTLALLVVLAVSAVLLAFAFSRQAAGLEALIVGAALALGVLPLAFGRGGVPARSQTGLLVLACLVALLAGAALGLGALGRSVRTATVLDASPDGRSTLVSDYFGPGALGSPSDIIVVRRDSGGVLRQERTIYWQEGTPAAPPRWVDDATVAVDGQRISVDVVPPVGW